MTKDEALKLALDVLENHTAIKHPQQRGYRDEAIEAIKEALGTCNPHPDAPHGFDRNSSHTEDRYVCECESWTPPQQIVTSDNSNSQQQEPYCWMSPEGTIYQASDEDVLKGSIPMYLGKPPAQQQEPVACMNRL